MPPPRLLAVAATLGPIDAAFPDVHDPVPEPVDLSLFLAMPKPSYLLDTSIVSGLVRRPAGRIRDSIAACGEERVCMCPTKHRS
jgi:hypothetical protein